MRIRLTQSIPVRAFVADLRCKPIIERFATAGLLAGLVLGAIGGLIRGLQVHPAMAWFAVFELAVPAAIAGALVGLVCGLTVKAGRWIKRHTAMRA
jgi:membrane associated rhomboid family serine protease